MTIPTTIILSAALVSASLTPAAETVPTITIYAEPPELEIWVDGARVGVGEAVLFGPFVDYVEVTVKGKGYAENNHVVDPPTEEDEDVVVVVVCEKVRGFSWPSLGIGAAIGIGTSLAFLGGFWGLY